MFVSSRLADPWLVVVGTVPTVSAAGSCVVYLLLEVGFVGARAVGHGRQGRQQPGWGCRVVMPANCEQKPLLVLQEVAESASKRNQWLVSPDHSMGWAHRPPGAPCCPEALRTWLGSLNLCTWWGCRGRRKTIVYTATVFPLARSGNSGCERFTWAKCVHVHPQPPT